MSVVLMNEVCDLSIKAVHFNPSPPLSCDIEAIEHAHVFKIRCARKQGCVPKSWSANSFRDDVEAFLYDYFTDHAYGMLNLKNMDCIALAQLLIVKLGLQSCSVSEDGIGGVEIFMPLNSDFNLENEHLRKTY